MELYPEISISLATAPDGASEWHASAIYTSEEIIFPASPHHMFLQPAGNTE